MWFDGSDVDESKANDFPELPIGMYSVIVDECTTKENLTTGSASYSTRFEVVDGQYRGRKFFQNYVYKNSSEQAVNIGRAKFKKLVMAVTGSAKISGPEELYDKPIKIKLGQSKPDKNGKRWPEILEYQGRSTGAVMPSAQPAAQAPSLDELPF